MALNIYNVKKWYRMLIGKSDLHVNQSMGQFFVPGEIKGYFNNLKDKVSREGRIEGNNSVIKCETENGSLVEFPTAIFQYGLGAYDLYLETGKNVCLSLFNNCVGWAIKNQNNNGSWNNFGYIYPDNPYSSMCQGEGASLLLRAYVSTDNKMYLDAAEKAIEFMLKPIEEGGTAKYTEKSLYLYEYTDKPMCAEWVDIFNFRAI